MKVKARFIRIAVIVVGLPLACWVSPPGLLSMTSGSWTMEQVYRGAAAVVIFFWSLIFAVNLRD